MTKAVPQEHKHSSTTKENRKSCLNSRSGPSRILETERTEMFLFRFSCTPSGRPEKWYLRTARLGTTGRDGRGKLMPNWSTVAKMPLCKVKAQLLKRWNRVTRSRVLRGGQRTLEGFVVRRAKVVSANDDGAAEADTSTAARADARQQVHSREQTMITAFAHTRVATAASSDRGHC